MTSFLRRYTQLGNPIAYSGRTNVKHLLPNLSRKRLEKSLNNVDSYTLHRESKSPKYNTVHVYRRRELLQLDLIDISALADSNDGIHFLLVGIDVFTKLAACIPLRRKTKQESARALAALLDTHFPPPHFSRCQTDRGTEWRNILVRRVFRDRGIEHSFPSNKPYHIERFNKTLQRLIYSAMTENNTHRYIDTLDQALRTYNARLHRMIGMTPVEADLPSNKGGILQAVSIEEKRKSRGRKRKPKFAINDVVRILRYRFTFARSYQPIWTEEVFKIRIVHTNMHYPMYEVTNWDGDEEIEGLFYEEELQARPSSVFKIIDVKRHKRVGGRQLSLVLFQGDRDYRWIPREDLTRL